MIGPGGRESGRDFAWLDEVRREHDEMASSGWQHPDIRPDQYAGNRGTDRMPTAEEVASWPNVTEAQKWKKPAPDKFTWHAPVPDVSWPQDDPAMPNYARELRKEFRRREARRACERKVMPVAIHRDHEFEYAERTTKTGRRDEAGKTSFETTTEQAPLTEAPLTEARRAYIASLSRSFDYSIYCEPERPDFGLNRFVVHGQADEWEPRTGPWYSRLLKWLVRRSL